MRSQVVTTGIVLLRRDFQEADRIIIMLTPDHGKISLIVKGVRRPKSKMAGGIELFSLSNITFLKGRGDLSTLISARLIRHYNHIVKDIKRTMLGYEMLKRLHRATEDAAEEDYFHIMDNSLQGLNDLELPIELVELWFSMQLLRQSGHAPNLKTNVSGNRLKPGGEYLFDHDHMAFKEQEGGPFKANHIKLLRLAYGTDNPKVLKQVKDADECAPKALELVRSMLTNYIRV